MNDLEFLKELRENVVKGKSDIARHEMALKMIDDWIDEKAAEHSVERTLIDIGDGCMVDPLILAAILPDEE
jgi:hypothetical protein